MSKYSWNYVRLVLMFSIRKKTPLSSKLKIHCSALFKMTEHQLRNFSGFWQLNVKRSNAHSRGVNSCWKYWLRSIFQCYKILCLLCAWLLSCSAVQYGAYIVILRYGRWWKLLFHDDLFESDRIFDEYINFFCGEGIE